MELSLPLRQILFECLLKLCFRAAANPAEIFLLPIIALLTVGPVKGSDNASAMLKIDQTSLTTISITGGVPNLAAITPDAWGFWNGSVNGKLEHWILKADSSYMQDQLYDLRDRTSTCLLGAPVTILLERKSVRGGIIFQPTLTGSVIAIDTNSQKIIAKYKTKLRGEQFSAAALLCKKGNINLISQNGNFYNLALDSNSQSLQEVSPVIIESPLAPQERAEFSYLSRMVIENPLQLIDKENIAFLLRETRISRSGAESCVDRIFLLRPDGSLIKKIDTQSKACTSPVATWENGILNGGFMYSSSDGGIHVFDGTGKELVAGIKRPSHTVVRPAVLSSGKFVFADIDRVVRIVDPHSGAELAHCSLPEESSTAVTVMTDSSQQKQLIVVSCFDGNVYYLDEFGTIVKEFIYRDRVGYGYVNTYPVICLTNGASLIAKQDIVVIKLENLH